MIDPIRDKLNTLFEQGVVIIPDYELMALVGAALDFANIGYRKSYYAGTFEAPAMYTFRLLTEDHSNVERLRNLLCAPDVPIREPDRGIPGEAAALEAVRARSRAAAQAPAVAAKVQRPSLALGAAAKFGAGFGFVAAIGVILYRQEVPSFPDNILGLVLYMTTIAIAGAVGATLGEIIEHLCERAYAHFQARRSRKADLH